MDGVGDQHGSSSAGEMLDAEIEKEKGNAESRGEKGPREKS